MDRSRARHVSPKETGRFGTLDVEKQVGDHAACSIIGGVNVHKTRVVATTSNDMNVKDSTHVVMFRNSDASCREAHRIPLGGCQPKQMI